MEVKCNLVLNKKAYSDTQSDVWYCGTCGRIKVVGLGCDPKVVFNCKETK
jgi:hypothetical protein